MTENDVKKGAIPLKPFHRFLRRRANKVAKSSVPFDWTKGYSLPFSLPILDQGQSESCGGQAGASFLTAQSRLRSVQEQTSAKSIYAPIAYPTGGTDVSSLETQICVRGACSEPEVPSYQEGYPPTEQFMTDLSWKTNSMIADAIKRAGYIPQRVNLDIDSIAQACRDNGGCIMEIQGQNNGTWLSPYPKPPVNNQNLWQHFMFLCNPNMLNGVKEITGVQSWGTSVGNGGLQYFTEEYFNSGYIVEVLTFLKDSPMTPTPNLLWKSILDWWETHMV